MKNWFSCRAADLSHLLHCNFYYKTVYNTIFLILLTHPDRKMRISMKLLDCRDSLATLVCETTTRRTSYHSLDYYLSAKRTIYLYSRQQSLHLEDATCGTTHVRHLSYPHAPSCQMISKPCSQLTSPLARFSGTNSSRRIITATQSSNSSPSPTPSTHGSSSKWSVGHASTGCARN